MQVLITGGAGFLGQRLARALLERGTLRLAGAEEQAISSLVLTDLVAPAGPLMDDARVRSVAGDLNSVLARTPSLVRDADLIVHLAAAVSGDCEADLDLGLHSNLDATLALLQAARHGERCPVLVYASSVAVFGAMPGLPLPHTIEDNTLPAPQSSYGIQKFTGEQLVADFTRRGLVDGRNVRLMTVAVRPGKPNGAASGFLSSMVREPLAGLRATVPVPPETCVALATPTNTIAGLLCAIESTAQQWGPRTAVNLPALSTTVGEIAEALKRAAGAEVARLLDWTPDARITSIVGGWPSRFHAQRAHDLSLRADSSADALLQDYLDTVRPSL
ncbi:D-erythronate dehydrogenase [Rhodoferax sp. GW822-FHT02A01]|uniref:D-erythronate dehydrogenase n=1 Tax=Rhodoferax sp. GW822-FHT02A01 TaxID=3141537 RepID=UPI00315DE894